MSFSFTPGVKFVVDPRMQARCVRESCKVGADPSTGREASTLPFLSEQFYDTVCSSTPQTLECVLSPMFAEKDGWRSSPAFQRCEVTPHGTLQCHLAPKLDRLLATETAAPPPG